MIKPPLKRFPQFYSGRKPTLTEEEMKYLFGHPFIVEEKMDGSIATIEEYDEKLGNIYLCLEDMKYVHTVFYDSLPSRYILVDMLNEDGSRIHRGLCEIYAAERGYVLPPLVMSVNLMRWRCVDKFLEFLASPRKSIYGSDIAEGFVVKSSYDTMLGGKWSSLDLEDEDRFDKTRLNHIIGQ